ncbi:sulfatase-like hydrolase/transferase [Rubripirellula sp.]|nr:sulfatase-like hydrolase/transferase [Rubripirellula sp.]
MPLPKLSKVGLPAMKNLIQFRIASIILISIVASQNILADQRPNVMVILCDDLGYGDLECYGHPAIKTPTLNRLAADGIRFTDCYSAAPVCSPSRVGLLTGRSPNRAGVYDWIPNADKPVSNKRHLVHMREKEKTIASFLQGAGYATCLVGKWHCNSEFNRPQQPQPDTFGFEHWFATQNNASPSHRNPNNFVRNGSDAGAIEGFSCQVVADEAIHWLEQKEKDKPFFLYVAFHEPHEPVASPAEIVAEYLDDARTEDEAQYFANVANMDLAVGRIMKSLTRLNLDENTLIIFTSDNGPETLNRYRSANRSYGQPGPLRGMKLHTTEAGFRVAGIIKWKNHLPQSMIGTVNQTTISSLDLLPTICELAHLSLPKEMHLDGTSITSLLQGNELTREKPLTWIYYNAINEARVAMRHERWKVLAKLDGGSLPKLTNVTKDSLPLIQQAKLTDIEIYDLKNDTSERQNIAKVNRELTIELTERLQREYQNLVMDSHAW